MLLFDLEHETLATDVRRDPSTDLPLLAEQRAIFELLLAYLPLPYSVAEYGCGKKTSLIFEQLLQRGVPAYALERGMIMEADMSDAMLAEDDDARRPRALTLDNPLVRDADLRDPKLLAMLDAVYVRVSVGASEIHAGPFVLRHRPRVQFIQARSHVFPIVSFWDDERHRVARRALDPTVDPEGFVGVERLREVLGAPEALVFTAPLLGRFRLHPDYLTAAQRRRLDGIAGGDDLLDMPYDEHARAVRELNGASEGSIGDPRAWTYANNIPSADAEYEAGRRAATGKGEVLRELTRRLFAAREAHARGLGRLRAALHARVEELGVRRVVEVDADRAERQLEPLADVAITVSYYNSLGELAAELARGGDGLSFLADAAGVDRVRGLGVRLRRRIDQLAAVSEDAAGRIDARALNERYRTAAHETIRQMNDAGLAVCVDRVGNLHGLSLTAAAWQALAAGRVTAGELGRRALAHVSHVDTVEDAGRLDGRLGVLSGIETAHVLRDLETYFDLPPVTADDGAVLMVTAFVGEEMTFTGNGVSMPGSAAVAGRATAREVHGMTDGGGTRFGDALVEMLRFLRRKQAEGTIALVNEWAGDAPEELLAGCFEPTDFFTPHTYERHIEQGPALDRHGVPLVLVDTIMGIHQEDVLVTGERAEAAALELALRCRELARRDDFDGVRVTVGVVEARGRGRSHKQPALAMRWRLDGEKNHAGSTAIEDRRDPGVAAARLARELRRWTEGRGLEPLVGEVTLDPGTNRNVIPGRAALKLGVAGALTPEAQRDLTRMLRGFALGTLSRAVASGGEGLRRCRSRRVSFVTTAPEVRLSIDLRAAETPEIDRFREALAGELAALGESFGVEVTSRQEQAVRPCSLARAGQVLQIERSFGGSHNANEAELTRDLVRGSLLQLAATRDVLARRSLDGFNLFAHVKARLPERWTAKLPRFVSGALHDTCNVTAATLARQDAQRPEDAS